MRPAYPFLLILCCCALGLLSPLAAQSQSGSPDSSAVAEPERTPPPVMLERPAAVGKPAQNPRPGQSTNGPSKKDGQGDDKPGTKIEIIDADVLEGMRVQGDNIRRLIGGVVLRQEETTMRCDSAIFFPGSNRVRAYGHVRIEQGDTIEAAGDSLWYDGDQRLARLMSSVRMRDRTMTLTTDDLAYDMENRVGRYRGSGRLINGSTVLTSTYGTYYALSQRAYFRDSVVLIDPEYSLTADTLEYRVAPDMAVFHGPTVIRHTSNTVYCTGGYYDGPGQEAVFIGRPTLDGPPRRVTADSIVYDQAIGLGRAWGDVVFEDAEKEIVQRSEYGEYDEVAGTMLSTDRSLLAFVLDGDSIFVAGDTVRSMSDSLQRRTLLAFGRVLIYRIDLQARCDSMAWQDLDSTINLFGDPVLWSDESQFTADTIVIALRNGQIRRVLLRQGAFIANEPDSLVYNQIKGRNGVGYFLDNALVRVDVTGNGQSIYFAEDDRTGYLGANKALCSALRIRVEEQQVKRISFLDKTDADFLTIGTLDFRKLLLDGFAWRLAERPRSVLDLKQPAPLVIPGTGKKNALGEMTPADAEADTEADSAVDGGAEADSDAEAIPEAGALDTPTDSATPNTEP